MDYSVTINVGKEHVEELKSELRSELDDIPMPPDAEIEIEETDRPGVLEISLSPGDTKFVIDVVDRTADELSHFITQKKIEAHVSAGGQEMSASSDTPEEERRISIAQFLSSNIAAQA